MSRGLGRLQRRILERLEESPERRLNRRQLEALLVEHEGYLPTNVLRAVRGLHRTHRVGFTDVADLDHAMVSLPRRVEPVSEEVIGRLLAEITR